MSSTPAPTADRRLSVAPAGSSAHTRSSDAPTVFSCGTAPRVRSGSSTRLEPGDVGPYLVGRVHEATGSFTPSLLAIAGLLVMTAVLALRVARLQETRA